MTGLAGAWFESTSVMFISGQVKRADLSRDTGVRQLGSQELAIVPVVKSLTKYAVCLMEPSEVRRELEKALYWMLEGRRGPAWIDIPLDVQSAVINPENLVGFAPPGHSVAAVDKAKLGELLALFQSAKRPVLLAGNGIHGAGAESLLRELIERFNLPTLTTWTAADLLENDHPLHFGRPGTAASRGANFAIQNADLLLAVGTRMDFSITGFDRAKFARDATIAVVDIDSAEIAKLGDLVDLAFVADAKDFISTMLLESGSQLFSYPDWVRQCSVWKDRYPVVLPEYRAQIGYLNSYVVAETLCEELSEDDLIVPGSSGAAIDTFWLAAKLKRGQRAVATGGLGSMGYGLPAAIGACLGGGRHRTVSVDGDGGFVMNIQELEVVCRLNLPIKFFVLNNNGYASIRASQSGYFKETIGCDPNSGMTLPDICAVAAAFGIKTARIQDQTDLRQMIRQVLDIDGPIVCEVMVQPDQAIGPRVSSRIKSDGTMVSTPLEDLFPFLDRDELKANMMVPLLED
jgi:acetolactate synthase-1/2/3 large subunit